MSADRNDGVIAPPVQPTAVDGRTAMAANAIVPASSTATSAPTTEAAPTPVQPTPSFSHLLDGAGQAQAAAQAAAAGGGQVSTSATPPVALTLPTPVLAPEFLDTLCVQVSVLARDGVQHAELHLNPAEMGPISVRIALDGSQAQVDFGVDSAATRALVESGLPELASALRDAGLTLTGGGVSQHARGQSGDGFGGRPGDGAQPGPQGGARERGDANTPADELPRPRTLTVAGGVDLYA